MYTFLKSGFVLLGLFFSISVSAQFLNPVCPSNSSTPKVLIAGDSWAQFMWDDDVHNIIFDKFGYADQEMISNSNATEGAKGYAISGSEAREWADRDNFSYIDNMIEALNANPTIETVVLSIGGNDVLAGKNNGGWYKDMDLDNPGSEEALFSTIETNTQVIIDAILDVRPELNVLLSSYDYPNFNVPEFFCDLGGCPTRTKLSRDGNDPVTDEELNQLIVTVEQRRLELTKLQSRVYFDNSVGLTHHYYGDGESDPGVLPRPGYEAPNHLPIPGGNIQRPILRENFRPFAGLQIDPIHLTPEAYQYKAAQQVDSYFLDRFLEDPNLPIFRSEGGSNDGWTTGSSMGTDGIYVGDDGNNTYHGIISFDNNQRDRSFQIDAASLYIIRESASGDNPFTNTGDFGDFTIDLKDGSFGNPAVEVSDATATATATDVGCFHGTVSGDYYALRIDLNQDAINALNSAADLTQFRISFPNMNSGTDEDAIVFYDGDDTSLPPASGNPLPHRGIVNETGNAAPFIRMSGFFVELPIVLNYFDAYKMDNRTELSWNSSSEVNSQGFIIERMEEHNQWIELGSVLSKNSNDAQQYTFTDTKPIKGLNYYRLKMLDQDGSFTYSDTRSVYFPITNPAVKVYPNPFEQDMIVEITGAQQDQLTLQIVDVLGKVVAVQSITLAQDGLNKFNLTLPDHLSQGNYILTILGDQIQRTLKIIKQ